MVTPISLADERGLLGLSLDSQLRKIFAALGEEQLRALARRVHEEAERRELVYEREGKYEVINVMLRPLGIFAEQLSYYHYVSLTLLGALKRLPELYMQDFQVREVVPLEEGEARWLFETWGAAHNQFHTVFGRLDAIADLMSPFPKEGLSFVEPNLVGVGGIHLVPTVEQIILELTLPVIQGIDPGLQLEAQSDLRQLFLQEISDHAEAIGRTGRTLCLIDPKYAEDGPNELETLSHFFGQSGLEVVHADPEELYVRGGEVYFENHPIDVAYRDYEVRELAQMEQEGRNTRPMKQLFRNNQMISSMAGDFDHKSCFELFSDPRFAHHFTSDERNVFRRHVLWTRVLREGRTTNERGEMTELLEFVRENRDQLVIKPNRAYGGESVLIGPSIGQSEWEAAILRGSKEPGQWVAQRLARLPGYEFPVISEEGSCTMSAFYVVVGLAPTKYGLGILGRASQKQVVNVAQRGGMVAVLVGKHRPTVPAPVPLQQLAQQTG